MEAEIENDKDLEIAEVENNKLMTLILNNDVIECRKTDGYINATQLCKAGNKLFGHWYRLASTKQLILELVKKINNKDNLLEENVINSNIQIWILDLVDAKVGGEHSSTWIHPDLAIQLAQWISPSFALQVSHWIRTLFVEGKVEVNIKLLKEQENTIKTCKSRIKHLENQILKKKSRTKYDNSKFVVYIITNKHKKKERTYTIGKAVDLVQRLSTYDKLEDHEVIYYKAFMDEEQMKTAEDMVLKKLHQYKEIECRDRFILPVGKDIKLFTKAIDNAYYFFNN